MKIPFISVVFFTAISMSSLTASALAQQPDATKKQTLVLEFRRLTGADRVNVSVNLSTEEVRNSLSEIVDRDPDLSDAQKQSLKKDVAESYARIDKVAKDFLANTDQLNKISEEVIFRLYDSTYSEIELGEAIAFYRSPVGKKTAAFLPALSAEVQKGFVAVVVPRLQAIVQPASESETFKLKQKIAEIKAKKPTD